MTAVLSLGGSAPSVTHAALDADRATLETSAGTVEARFRTTSERRFKSSGRADASAWTAMNRLRATR